jgi:hypothetical protein
MKYRREAGSEVVRMKGEREGGRKEGGRIGQ